MSWKRKIRPVTDRVAKYSGLLWAHERRMRSRITMLMYHRILEDADCPEYPFPSLVMPRSLFEAQLDWLAEHARVSTVSNALNHAHDSSIHAKPLVCLTFDDGYVDNFELAAPMLEARGLCGTFFITAGAVEARETLWFDRAATVWTLLGREEILRRVREVGATETHQWATHDGWVDWLKGLPNDQRDGIVSMLADGTDDVPSPCPLMTADQVGQLAQRGHEIGSHTLWHPILTTMATDRRREEIEGAKKLLQRWTDCKVAGFCYPNGEFDEEVIRLLNDAGHSYACTTRAGRNDRDTDLFQLRRIDMTVDRVVGVDGRFDPLGFRAEISLLREGLRCWAKP